MARFYPAHPTGTEWPSEARVRRYLEKLDGRWHVFHSVAWQSKRGGREADGEADFVLLNPAFGIVVLEVKGGRLDVAEGRWFSTDRHDVRHEIKNPFLQARESKYALVRYLSASEPPMPTVPICYGVVFPDATQLDAIGPAGPREIQWDANDLLDVSSAVARLLQHWGQKAALSGDAIARIARALAPTVAIRTCLRNVVAATNEQLLELTQQQVGVMRQLRRNRRMLVLGSAGTGKTVLAAERARHLAAEGFDTLLTCFNAPLAAKLAEDVAGDPRVTAASFHHLCMAQAKRAGLRVPLAPSDSWWAESAPDLLVEGASKNSLAFDAVVVDEGQDFAPAWFEALLLLLRNSAEGPFLVFADTHQQIYRQDWSPPGDWPQVELDINCRSSLPIARHIAAVFGDEPVTLGASGQEPAFINAGDLGEAIEAAQHAVNGLISRERLRPQQIVVLSDARAVVDELRTRLAGDHAFVEIGQTGITTETVHRFKGLEADVVVLIVADRASGSALERAALAYTGMSRARAALIVIGPPHCRSDWGW